jgi:hypothetical protein
MQSHSYHRQSIFCILPPHLLQFQCPAVYIYCDSILSVDLNMSQCIIGMYLAFSLILGTVAMPSGRYAQAHGCMLEMTLTVKDTQDGFAGTTGTVWTIDPDCTFRVSRLFGQHVAEPHLRGSLTPEQQARLSAILAKAAVAELPAQMGETPSVNARRITLEYGGKLSVLSMRPGDRDMDALRAGDPLDPARRLLEVADAVQDMLGN